MFKFVHHDDAQAWAKELETHDLDQVVECMIEAGETIVWPHIWGFRSNGEMTEAFDLKLTLTSAMTVENILTMFEGMYTGAMLALGAEPRQALWFEGFEPDGFGQWTIEWGS